MLLNIHCSFILLCVILLGIDRLDSAPTVNEIHPPFAARQLIIKAFPAIENYQSDLYEVFAEPYLYGQRRGKSREDLGVASAVVVLQGEGETDVKGEILFKQQHPPAGPVLIQGNLTGLPAGKHGVHIHQAGDLRQGCEKLGGHFNPYLLHHGGPADPVRHVGDLGNVEADEDGNAELKLIDPLMSLSGGPRGVVGRAIVITAGQDDLGRGGTADSLETGDAGKPLACGVIAYIR